MSVQVSQVSETPVMINHRVDVKNLTSKACTLPSVPWVLLLDGNGVVISSGAPLGALVESELPPGETARSVLTVGSGEVLGAVCDEAMARTMVVGLFRNDPKAQRVPMAAVACHGRPTVQMMTFTV